MPGFIAAATATGSVPAGRVMARRRSTTARSAIVPWAPWWLPSAPGRQVPQDGHKLQNLSIHYML